MINKCVDVLCPRCGKVTKLEIWNNLTYSMCSTREMRRAYTQLYEEKAFRHESNTFYVCPQCHQWSRGSQLRITNTDNTELKKLGGRSVVVRNENKKS